jgi:hypothetical protein
MDLSSGDAAEHHDGHTADARPDRGPRGALDGRWRDRVAPSRQDPEPHHLPRRDPARAAAGASAGRRRDRARRLRGDPDVEPQRAPRGVFRDPAGRRGDPHAQPAAAPQRDRLHRQSRARPLRDRRRCAAAAARQGDRRRRLVRARARGRQRRRPRALRGLPRHRRRRRAAAARRVRRPGDLLHQRHHGDAQGRGVQPPLDAAPHPDRGAARQPRPVARRHADAGRADVPRQRVGPAVHRRDDRRPPGVPRPASRRSGWGSARRWTPRPIAGSWCPACA